MLIADAMTEKVHIVNKKEICQEKSLNCKNQDNKRW